MRRYLSYALILVAFLTLTVWAVSQFIQPILPNNINGGLILFFAVLLSVVGVIAGFKDIVELVHMLTNPNKRIEDVASTSPFLQASTQINYAEHVVIESVLQQTQERDRLNSNRVTHNLPQPDYGEFVGREKELAQVVRILRPYPHSQYPLVTIDGIGGIGKTALALEVAHRYLRNFDSIPPQERFDTIIWASAKRTVLTAEGIIPRQPALQTLEDIYKTIAITLQQDLGSSPNQHTQIICNMLTPQRTLLVIDNLETVDDESVMSFLRELPAPTKAIVTTRHRIDVAYPVRLMGMPEEDAQTLIVQECGKKSVMLDKQQSKRLYARTGGGMCQ